MPGPGQVIDVDSVPKFHWNQSGLSESREQCWLKQGMAGAFCQSAVLSSKSAHASVKLPQI